MAGKNPTRAGQIGILSHAVLAQAPFDASRRALDEIHRISTLEARIRGGDERGRRASGNGRGGKAGVHPRASRQGPLGRTRDANMPAGVRRR